MSDFLLAFRTALRVNLSGVFSTSRVAALAWAGAILAIAATAPSVTYAKQARLFAGTFGDAASTPVNPYPLSSAGSIAVDRATHDVYVANSKSHQIEKFDSSGHFLLMLGSEVNKTAVEERTTREAEEDVCPAAGHPTDVCQQGRSGPSAGALEDPAFLAVDNSAGESKGDLYVGDLGHTVTEQQTVTVSASGGTFKLSFEGETTVPIAFNASASEGTTGSVQTALRALPAIGGEVRVSGSPGSYKIEFPGIQAGHNVPQMTCDGSTLSDGGASCVVATAIQGSSTARVEKFDPSAHPVAAWGQAGQLDGSAVVAPPAPVPGPFVQIDGIAVDPSGNLWVSAGIGGTDVRMFEFRADSSFATGWTGFVGEIAVDSADNVYLRDGSGRVRKLDSLGDRLGDLAPSQAEYQEKSVIRVAREAVNTSTDDVYIDGQEGSEPLGNQHGVVRRYDSTCHPIFISEFPEPGCVPVESFGAGLLSAPGDLAIDPSTEALYIAEGGHVTFFSYQTVPDVLTEKPRNPTHTSATLTASVEPGGVELNPSLEGCRFEWGETVSYGHTVPCDKTAAQIGKGSEAVEVHADIAGLAPGRTYHYRLVASNANDVNSSIDEPSFGADLTFGPSLIETASVISVDAASATLQAQVNPNDLDTRVRIEYGTEAAVYTQSTAEVDAGSAGNGRTVSLHLSGLAPAMTYHYRAVAENVLAEGAEAVTGADQTFTTQAIGASSLLDDRGWELVSPPNKHGANLASNKGFGLVQAAINGDAITYLASAPTEVEPPGNVSSQVQVLTARFGNDWSSRDIATPNDIALGQEGTEYKFFSPDLSLGVAQPNGEFVPEISPEASEQTPYLRSDYSSAELGALCAASCYRPLVTAKPGFANVPIGTEFGRHVHHFGGEVGPNGVDFRGASPDGGHVILQSYAALTEGAPLASLYEWSAGRLQLVSVLPGEGGPVSNGVVFGGDSSVRNAISTDGSRVIWSETPPGKLHLYLRAIAAEETLQIDLNKGGSGKGLAEPHFQAASSDESVILFTDEQQLTPDAGASLRKPDLYRCDVVTGETGELECALTDLSPANGTESADVQGILGAAEDGSSVYFVANGVLAPGGTPGDCGVSNVEITEATCNLYVHRGATTNFIASLGSADRHDWSDELHQPTRVSPNGEWLELMSQHSLTGYDGRDIATGMPTAEVFLYDAADKKLQCVSCDPSGARPRGVEYLKLERAQTGTRGSWDQHVPVAADVPAWSSTGASNSSGYQNRYLSDSGRVFFNASDGLVPGDSNGTQDVYEFEPAGVGTCSESSQTFSARAAGCVALMSSGTSREESAFLDASESGNDVFFLTAARLSGRDTDTAYDVYDARVGGGEPEPVKPVECQGAACQSFVSPPNDPTPGSLTFSGPGNLVAFAPMFPAKKAGTKVKTQALEKALRACRRDRSKRKRARCEAAAHRKHGAVNTSRRANNDRRAKS